MTRKTKTRLLKLCIIAIPSIIAWFGGFDFNERGANAAFLIFWTIAAAIWAIIAVR